MGYIYLFLSIFVGTFANILLKYSDGYSKPIPTIGNIIFFILGVWFLSISVTTINLGVAYATWSGLGIVLAAIAGKVLFHENLSRKTLSGMALTTVGVVILNFF